jgi:hypothetical protein
MPYEKGKRCLPFRRSWDTPAGCCNVIVNQLLSGTRVNVSRNNVSVWIAKVPNVTVNILDVLIGPVNLSRAP